MAEGIDEFYQHEFWVGLTADTRPAKFECLYEQLNKGVPGFLGLSILSDDGLVLYESDRTSVRRYMENGQITDPIDLSKFDYNFYGTSFEVVRANLHGVYYDSQDKQKLQSVTYKYINSVISILKSENNQEGESHYLVFEASPGCPLIPENPQWKEYWNGYYSYFVNGFIQREL